MELPQLLHWRITVCFVRFSLNSERIPGDEENGSLSLMNVVASPDATATAAGLFLSDWCLSSVFLSLCVASFIHTAVGSGICCQLKLVHL